MLASDVGKMTPKTWAALFNSDATGFTEKWAQILPLAQQPYTRKWRRSADGSIIGREPRYAPRRLQVHRTIDFGVGHQKRQMREWCRIERDKVEGAWIGTIALETGAVIAGNHAPGDPLTEADIMPASAIRPGMNVSLPLFMGGIVVHVVGVSVSGGKVTLSVDSLARPTLTAWEVIRRNRESRRDPQRQWERSFRSSTMARDAINEFSENGGITPARELKGGQWNIVEVFSGRSGSIHELKMETNPNAEYMVAIFADRISEKRLEAAIGDPFTAEGRRQWRNTDVYERLRRDHLMVYVAGEPGAPCGYSPGDPPSKDDAAIITGAHYDDADFDYYVGPANVLRVAIFPDRDTTLRGGRIMWPNLQPG